MCMYKFASVAGSLGNLPVIEGLVRRSCGIGTVGIETKWLQSARLQFECVYGKIVRVGLISRD